MLMRLITIYFDISYLWEWRQSLFFSLRSSSSVLFRFEGTLQMRMISLPQHFFSRIPVCLGPFSFLQHSQSQRLRPCWADHQMRSPLGPHTLLNSIFFLLLYWLPTRVIDSTLTFYLRGVQRRIHAFPHAYLCESEYNDIDLNLNTPRWFLATCLHLLHQWHLLFSYVATIFAYCACTIIAQWVGHFSFIASSFLDPWKNDVEELLL